ncbi:MAG: hypothetical protein NC343_06470 [Muribaculum sp.]|nr:hypothetical protein [Muribaculaceae bacterium]MCM1081378.1 hypothetical protein [Muribaculum sp.]
MKPLRYILLATISSALFTACSNKNEWTVKGTIEGAENAPIAIEVAENGVWLPIDTLSTDNKGKFSYSRKPLGYPDIFRLAYNKSYVYFPIDSIETIEIETTSDNFASNATISGSESANRIQQVDKRIKQSVDSIGIDGALSDSILKRDLSQMILANPADIVSYYIICKQIGNRFIFDPSLSLDNRVLGAVANSFTEQRPSDPRTKFLKSVYLANKAAGSQATGNFEIKEIGYYDIALTDNTGKEYKLSDAVNNNKVVLLNFTVYGADISPALNVALSEAYSKYKNNSFEIYQVALDDDEFFWKQSANNLPWITVYNPPVASNARQVLVNYNVQAVPVSYLFVNGELIERVDDYENLTSTIGRHF